MGKIAFVFAGQGAQTPGMGKDLYDNFPAAQKIFDTAEEIRPGIKELCFSGSREDLNETINAQPALFCVDLAYAKVLQGKGITADGTAGFSLGEVPAAAFSGVMSTETAFRFVCKRAEFMDECAKKTKGEMLAVLKLEAAEVENICKQFDGAYAVNYNCPGQTVVAVKSKIANELTETVAKSGGRVIKIAAKGLFHSPYMESASEKIKEYLKTVTIFEPEIPLYSNFSAGIYTYDIVKTLLSNQISNPVLWQKEIENMIAAGFERFIECGPGKVLTGLIGKINTKVTAVHANEFIN